MGNKKRDYFHNLSRKELQGLCKKHGLSAIGTTPHLLKLLFSYLKGESRSSPFCEERPSVVTDVTTASHISNLQHGPPVPHLEVSFQVKDGSSKKIVEATIGKEKTNHLASQVLEKAPDIIASMENTLHGNITNDEATCCLTSKDSGRDVNIAHPVSANQRERDYKKDNVSDPAHHWDLVHSQPDPPPIQYTACPAVSNQASPRKCNANTKKSPSFQFYVSSEEGINLFVDLTSSPSAWIKSLKDEVHICQNQQDSFLHNGPGGFDESMTTSVCTGMQTSSLERRLDFLHTRSSLGSLTRNNPLYLTVERPDPSGQDNSVISSSYDLNGGRIPQTANAVSNECTCDLVATMHTDAIEQCQSNPSHCPVSTTEIAEAHSGSLSNVDSCVPGKLEAFGDFSSSNIGSFNSQNIACQGNSASVSLERQLARNSCHNEEDDVPPGFLQPLAVMEARNAEMQDQHFDEGSCNLKEQQRSQTEYTRERIPHGSGSTEAFPSIRHRLGEILDSGPAGTTIRNSGTATHLTREKLAPRRSKRLGSK